MTAEAQLTALSETWRDRHGPEVQRRRSTYVIEEVVIALEDGRQAKLSRKADDSLYHLETELAKSDVWWIPEGRLN
jgi:hypothetical protein